MRPMLVAVAILGLVAATPPGWFPGAGLLVVPGLAAFYALATTSRRPYLLGYLVGLGHVAGFSWSLHHALWFGYVAIALLGAVYYALAVFWMRVIRRWVPGSIAFGVAVAGTQALRAVMPEIAYPHGQPAHCLYHWPSLLGPVSWGGVVLANVLLAGGAAALVDLYRSWRAARPPWRGARNLAVGWWVLWSILVAVSPPSAAGVPGTVRVLAVQPNVPPDWVQHRRAREWLELAFVRPTEQAAGPGVSSPPDLVLWPETSYPRQLDARGPRPTLVGGALRVALAANTRLLAGTEGLFGAGRRTPVGVLVDARGRLVGFHEKRELVAAGEYLPLVGLLPDSWRSALEDAIAASMGGVPRFAPGDAQPLLETAGGVPFGALLCYDNAFPAIARDQVDRGARFLAVLSNEAWYRGGAELDQLVAATVCRALETATPVVRCTMDGATLVVDAGGQITAQLPYGGGEPAQPAFLAADLELGPGAVPPLSWLHALVGWLLFVSSLPVAWRVLGSWARLVGPRSVRVEKPVHE